MSRVSFCQGSNDTTISLPEESLGDVSAPKLHQKNQKKWTSGKAPHSSSTTKPFPHPEQWIPIGVNGFVAAGFKCKCAKVNFERLKDLEETEFARYWMTKLVRCNHRMQFESVMKKFLGVVEKDPSLRSCAEKILRSEELIRYRDGLSVDAEATGGIEYRPIQRDAPEHHMKEITRPAGPDYDRSALEIGVVMTQSHAGSGWKDRFVFRYLGGTAPAGYLGEDNSISIAHYVTESDVRFAVYSRDHKLIREWFCPGMEGPLMCARECVASPYVLHEFNKVHALEGDVFTSISNEIASGLVFGTQKGFVFHVDSETFTRTQNNLAVLNLSCSGYAKCAIQNIGEVSFEGSNVAFVRLLAVSTKGRHFIVLCKNGSIILWTLDGQTVMFEAMNDISCNIGYYANGIWESDDMGEFCVMYPNGSVCRKALA